jgi:hypothetical protein
MQTMGTKQSTYQDSLYGVDCRIGRLIGEFFLGTVTGPVYLNMLLAPTLLAIH